MRIQELLDDGDQHPQKRMRIGEANESRDVAVHDVSAEEESKSDQHVESCGVCLVEHGMGKREVHDIHLATHECEECASSVSSDNPQHKRTLVGTIILLFSACRSSETFLAFQAFCDEHDEAIHKNERFLTHTRRLLTNPQMKTTEAKPQKSVNIGWLDALSAAVSEVEAPHRLKAQEATNSFHPLGSGKCFIQQVVLKDHHPVKAGTTKNHVRSLSCPICKNSGIDRDAVPNGTACRGGHCFIDNRIR